MKLNQKNIKYWKFFREIFVEIEEVRSSGNLAKIY